MAVLKNGCVSLWKMGEFGLETFSRKRWKGPDSCYHGTQAVFQHGEFNFCQRVALYNLSDHTMASLSHAWSSGMVVWKKQLCMYGCKHPVHFSNTLHGLKCYLCDSVWMNTSLPCPLSLKYSSHFVFQWSKLCLWPHWFKFLPANTSSATLSLFDRSDIDTVESLVKETREQWKMCLELWIWFSIN